jgi:hypothetical protein
MQIGPMQIGVFAKTFPGDVPRAVFTACRDAGFHTVQYNMACSGLGSLPPEIPAETGKASRQRGGGNRHACGGHLRDL